MSLAVQLTYSDKANKCGGVKRAPGVRYFPGAQLSVEEERDRICKFLSAPNLALGFPLVTKRCPKHHSAEVSLEAVLKYGDESFCGQRIPEMQAAFAKLGLQTRVLSAKEYAGALSEEVRLWKTVVDGAGVHME